METNSTMMDLKNFLACLPGIKPLVTRRMILDGQILSPAQKADLHGRDAYFLDTVLMVGPVAAEAILKAYKAGRLPMIRARQRPSEAPRADAYVAEADRWIAELAEWDRRKRAIEDISLLRPTDLFDYRLLDEIFVRQIGLGRGTLILAGIEVTKSLLEFASNSGKSADWQVSFSWREAEGNSQTITKESRYSSNRRNDAERDWGLPD